MIIINKLVYPNIEDSLNIRMAVFVDEQGYSKEDELDGIDHECIHYVGYDENKPVCTMRVIVKDDCYKLGRIAVLKEERKKGYGFDLVKAVMEELTDKYFKLSSQVHAVPFYEKLGFVTDGEEYLEDGQPHILMIKK